MTGVASWSLLRFEVWGWGGGGVEDVLVLIQISFNPSFPTLCPSIRPPHPPPTSFSLHPPITCHPKGVIQAGSLERNGLKREAGLLSVSLSPSHMCVCVCALRLNTLFVVCVRLCQKGRGGERGSRWTASLLSAVLCSHLLSPSFSLYLLSVPLSPLFPSVFSSLMSSSFHSLFFTTLFFLFLHLSPSVVL